MSSYLVLARKYRSATFDEVVGQEHVAQTLKNAIAIGRVAHAFLFTGTRGVGKTTMARILAKALNCLSSPSPTTEPCNQCDACRAIARGDDMDVIEIDGASNRGIDEIRNLRSNAIYLPSRCRYRIYYIDEVHMLTKEAFNALLKTLEEPPEHVKFIFATTETEKVPATILSRCQKFDFRNIPTRQIADHLRAVCAAEKVEADDDAIFRIARSAAGSMRDGLSLLDQLLSAGQGRVTEADVLRVLGTPGEERTAQIVAAIAAGSAAATLEAFDALLASGVTLESALGAVGEVFRQMMLIQSCGADSPLVELSESQKAVVADLAKKFTLPALVQAVSLCQNTVRNLRGLTSGRGLAEAALVRLAAADKFVDAASLVERLEQVGGGGGRGPGPAPGGGGPGGGGGTGYQPSSGYGRGPAPAPARTYSPPPQRKTTPSGAAPDPLADPGQARSGGTGFQPVPGYGGAPAQPAAVLPWDIGYVQQNWAEVVAAAGRHKAWVSGLLTVARPVGIEGDRLRLAYDESFGGMRQRAERMDRDVTGVLAQVFGRPVRCEYLSAAQVEPPANGAASVGAVAVGRAGLPAEPQGTELPRASLPALPTAGAAPVQTGLAQAPKPVPPPKVNYITPVSSAERAEIQQDPSVKAVMELFDGSITDIRREPPAADAEDSA